MNDSQKTQRIEKYNISTQKLNQGFLVATFAFPLDDWTLLFTNRGFFLGIFTSSI